MIDKATQIEHQHSLMMALNSLSRLASTIDKVEITIQRCNSHEYVVSSMFCAYYISMDDAGMYWHVYMLQGFKMSEDALSIHLRLEKAIDWAYGEIFKHGRL